MWKDAIAEEVREARDRLAERFDYDLGALVSYFREKERLAAPGLVRRGPPPRERAAEEATRRRQR